MRVKTKRRIEFIWLRDSPPLVVSKTGRPSPCMYRGRSTSIQQCEITQDSLNPCSCEIACIRFASLSWSKCKIFRPVSTPLNPYPFFIVATKPML